MSREENQQEAWRPGGGHRHRGQSAAGRQRRQSTVTGSITDTPTPFPFPRGRHQEDLALDQGPGHPVLTSSATGHLARSGRDPPHVSHPTYLQALQFAPPCPPERGFPPGPAPHLLTPRTCTAGRLCRGPASLLPLPAACSGDLARAPTARLLRPKATSTPPTDACVGFLPWPRVPAGPPPCESCFPLLLMVSYSELKGKGIEW